MVNGASEEGFTITALPAASAAAVFTENDQHGKLKGITQAMTPNGSRTAISTVFSVPGSQPAGMISS